MAERSRVGNPRNGRLGSLRYAAAAPVHGPKERPLGLEALHEPTIGRARLSQRAVPFVYP